MLDCVLAYESGEWTPGEAPAAEHMQQAFWDAAEYARSMMSQMAAAAESLNQSRRQGAVASLLLAVVGGGTVLAEVVLVAQRLGDRPR